MLREITTILAEAGSKGLSPYKISRHVFNITNNLFNPVSFDDVYGSVVLCLRRESRKHNGMFIHAAHSRYTLNKRNAEVARILSQLNSTGSESPEEKKTVIADKNQLSLF